MGRYPVACCGVVHQYNALGQRTGMTAPDGGVVEYTYDSANRLANITEGTQTFAFTYDSTGRRTALSYPNGAVASYAYDAAGSGARPTSPVWRVRRKP